MTISKVPPQPEKDRSRLEMPVLDLMEYKPFYFRGPVFRVSSILTKQEFKGQVSRTTDMEFSEIKVQGTVLSPKWRKELLTFFEGLDDEAYHHRFHNFAKPRDRDIALDGLNTEERLLFVARKHDGSQGDGKGEIVSLIDIAPEREKTVEKVKEDLKDGGVEVDSLNVYELGIISDKKTRGQGISTEFLRKVVKHLQKERPDIHSLIAQVEPREHRFINASAGDLFLHQQLAPGLAYEDETWHVYLLNKPDTQPKPKKTDSVRRLSEKSIEFNLQTPP